MADKRITELPVMAKGAVDGTDVMITYDVQSNSTQQMTIDSLFANARADVQGYFGLLTNFYFTGGVATETVIEIEDINTWTDVSFPTDAEGLFDKRPTEMKDALADPYDDASGYFSLEGLSQNSSVMFRASMTFEPDEDEGQLTTRLNFERHSGTTPSEDFQITDVALSMGQGADIEYPAEPTLTFFVGDTIDTAQAGDAGQCKFQVNSTVPGTIKMLALTWYIQR